VSVWRETVVNYFKVISRNAPGYIEENLDKLEAQELVTLQRFKQGIFRIQSTTPAFALRPLFAFYLTTLSVAQTVYRRMIG
jgi:hypothetical protein